MLNVFILSDYQAYSFWIWKGFEYSVIGGSETSFKTSPQAVRFVSITNRTSNVITLTILMTWVGKESCLLIRDP